MAKKINVWLQEKAEACSAESLLRAVSMLALEKMNYCTYLPVVLKKRISIGGSANQ